MTTINNGKEIEMKLKDVISKIVDNYYPITIEVFDRNTQLIEKRYKIEAHKTIFDNIPDDVKELAVEMIVPYYDSLSICVMKGSDKVV